MEIFTFLLFITAQAIWLVDPSGSSQDVLVVPLHDRRQFNCITPDNTYSHTWYVNTTWAASSSTFPDVVDISSETLSNGSTLGSLTFMAHSQVNNTEVDCTVSDGYHILPQLDYVIIIQGYLSPPDVVYVMEHHSVRFSWSAPFSLNITDYEPDILYYVITIITADDITTMNTTDSVYLLQPELCLFSEYRVEIAAVNIVGMGEKYTSPPLSLEVLSLSGASIIFSKDLTVITIQISTNCSDDIHYNVELIPTFSTKRIVISNSSSVGQTSLTLSSSDIQINERYKATVRVMGSTFLHHLEISTFDVQTVEIKPQNDVKESTDITCYFALGSKVKGCRIVVSKNSNDLDNGKSIDIEQCEYAAIREEGRSEGTISVMLPKGEYTVVVYDDEEVEVENLSYTTSITIARSPSISLSGCPSTSTVTNDQEKSKSAVVAVTLVAAIFALWPV